MARWTAAAEGVGPAVLVGLRALFVGCAVDANTSGRRAEGRDGEGLRAEGSEADGRTGVLSPDSDEGNGPGLSADTGF